VLQVPARARANVEVVAADVLIVVAETLPPGAAPYPPVVEPQEVKVVDEKPSRGVNGCSFADFRWIGFGRCHTLSVCPAIYDVNSPNPIGLIPEVVAGTQFQGGWSQARTARTAAVICEVDDRDDALVTARSRDKRLKVGEHEFGAPEHAE
jgi:hypothetical protein